MFMPGAVVPIALAPGGVVRVPQPATEMIKATQMMIAFFILKALSSGVLLSMLQFSIKHDTANIN